MADGAARGCHRRPGCRVLPGAEVAGEPWVRPAGDLQPQSRPGREPVRQDLQLDADLSRESVLKKLDELERIARRNGTAIGIASAFDESVDAIREWCEEAGGRGVEVVGVASLADIPAKK